MFKQDQGKASAGSNKESSGGAGAPVGSGFMAAGNRTDHSGEVEIENELRAFVVWGSGDKTGKKEFGAACARNAPWVSWTEPDR